MKETSTNSTFLTVALARHLISPLRYLHTENSMTADVNIALQQMLLKTVLSLSKKNTAMLLKSIVFYFVQFTFIQIVDDSLNLWSCSIDFHNTF